MLPISILWPLGGSWIRAECPYRRGPSFLGLCCDFLVKCGKLLCETAFVCLKDDAKIDPRDQETKRSPPACTKTPFNHLRLCLSMHRLCSKWCPPLSLRNNLAVWVIPANTLKAHTIQGLHVLLLTSSRMFLKSWRTIIFFLRILASEKSKRKGRPFSRFFKHP